MNLSLIVDVSVDLIVRFLLCKYSYENIVWIQQSGWTMQWCFMSFFFIWIGVSGTTKWVQSVLWWKMKLPLRYCVLAFPSAIYVIVPICFLWRIQRRTFHSFVHLYYNLVYVQIIIIKYKNNKRTFSNPRIFKRKYGFSCFHCVF